MYGAEPIQGIAGGNITGARFIKLSTAADETLLQAGANDPIFGVAGQATRDAPLDGASTLLAASGDQFHYVPEGNVCLMEAGSGGWTRGDLLKSDTDGTAISAATTGATAQNIGAQALESASAGELGRVIVKLLPKYYPALS